MGWKNKYCDITVVKESLSTKYRSTIFVIFSHRVGYSTDSPTLQDSFYYYHFKELHTLKLYKLMLYADIETKTFISVFLVCVSLTHGIKLRCTITL